METRETAVVGSWVKVVMIQQSGSDSTYGENGQTILQVRTLLQTASLGRNGQRGGITVGKQWEGLTELQNKELHPSRHIFKRFCRGSIKWRHMELQMLESWAKHEMLEELSGSDSINERTVQMMFQVRTILQIPSPEVNIFYQNSNSFAFWWDIYLLSYSSTLCHRVMQHGKPALQSNSSKIHLPALAPCHFYIGARHKMLE